MFENRSFIILSRTMRCLSSYYEETQFFSATMRSDTAQCLGSHTIYTSESDAQTLQDDLLKLEQWESDWSMEFNPDKCEVIRVTKKQKPIIFPYKLHNIELKATENAKYLGITI